jgi:hypothetical protein
MKNETRKKPNNSTNSLEFPDLRAEIARRAYEIWLNEGGAHGSDLDHWLQAERECADRQEKALGLKTSN